MSHDLYIALSRGLPDVAALDKTLADRGGAEGTWENGVQLGGVALVLADDAAPLVSALLAKAKKKITIDRVLRVIEGDVDDVEDIGEILLAYGGGALVSETGAVLLSRSGPKKPIAEKAGTAKKVATRSPAFDTSIPQEVLNLLGGIQAHYEVHPRDAPTASLRVMIKAVPMPIPEVEFGPSASPSTKIGSVLFSRARVVFRTSFDPWYVKEADPDAWNATLHLACALARHTRGVLLRRLDDERDVRFDFDPTAPLPATVPLAIEACEHFAGVAFERLQHGSGEMVGMGRKIALRWHIPGVTEPAENTVVLGAAKTNPALACLHGEQLNGTLRITIAKPRGLSSRVPPIADGESATLEVTILRALK